MSDHANLISDNVWAPACANEDGEANYASRDIVSHGGKYIVPLFWLTAFRKSDLIVKQVDGQPISCLLTGKKHALRNLEISRDSLCGEFSNLIFHWPRWEEIVRGTRGEYLKVDTQEIWAAEPADHEQHLPQALEWFSSGDEDHREALLNFCGFSADARTRTLRLGSGLVTGNHLYGCVGFEPR